MRNALPFLQVPTAQPGPGALAVAYIPRTANPLQMVCGRGTPITGQFAIDLMPYTVAQAVPEAWRGIESGQFVLQPLMGTQKNGS